MDTQTHTHVLKYSQPPLGTNVLVLEVWKLRLHYPHLNACTFTVFNESPFVPLPLDMP